MTGNEAMSKVITLPSADEIMKRLISVDDTEMLVERLYPRVAQHAGHETVASFIILLLTLGIDYFMEEGDNVPLMSAILHMNMPGWIDELIADEAVAVAAKNFYMGATIDRYYRYPA